MHTRARPRGNGSYGILVWAVALQESWLPRYAEMLSVTGTFRISQSEAAFNTGTRRQQNPLQSDLFIQPQKDRAGGCLLQLAGESTVGHQAQNLPTVRSQFVF